MSSFNDKKNKITASTSKEQSTDVTTSDPIIAEVAKISTEASPVVTVDKIQEPTSTPKDTGSADFKTRRQKKRSSNKQKSGGSHVSDNSSSSVTATKIAGYSTGTVNAYSVFDAAPNANNYVAQRYSTVNSFRRYNSDEYNINFKNWGQLGKLVEGKDVYQLNVERPNVLYNNDNYKNDYINNRVYSNMMYETAMPMFLTHTKPGIMYYNNILNVSGILNRSTTTSTDQQTILNNMVNGEYNTTGILTLAPIDVTDASGVSQPIMNIRQFDKNSNQIEYYYQNGYQSNRDNSYPLNRDYLNLNYSQYIPRDYYVSYSSMNRRLWFDIAWNSLSNYSIDEQSVLPLNAIQSVQHYSIVMNSIAKLKTFLWIVKDAINGAISSQTILAAKLGTIDSTFATFAHMPSAVVTQYENALNALDKALEGFPVIKDVIESWNKVKSWSKSNDGNLFTTENTLHIPTFILAFDQLFDYSATNPNGTTEDLVPRAWETIKPLTNDLVNRDRRLMTPFRLNISSNYVNIPHGDWLSMFISGVLTRQKIEQFFRIEYPSATGFNDTFRVGNQNQVGWATTGTNNLTIGNIATDFATMTHTQCREHFSDVPHIELSCGSYDNPEVTETFPTVGDSRVNFRGDFVISYHTMTAWMHMFIQKMFDNSNWIARFINNINAVKPFFNLLNQVVPIKDYYSLDYNLQPVKFGLIKGTEPEYDKVRNRLITSSWFRRRWARDVNLYIDATNVNNFTIEVDNNLGLTNRNALTISTASTYLDQEGKALSNIYNNRVRAIGYDPQHENDYTHAVILMNSDVLFKDWNNHMKYIGSHAFLMYGLEEYTQADLTAANWAPEATSYVFMDAPAISRVGNNIRNRFLSVNCIENDDLYSSEIFSAFDQPFTVIQSDTDEYVADTYDVPAVAFMPVLYNQLYYNTFGRIASLVSIRASASTAEKYNKMLADSTYKPDKNSGNYISEADLIGL